jgi:hypothetical protein
VERRGAVRERQENSTKLSVAAVQQPNFLMVAANKESGITDLSQVKTRTQLPEAGKAARSNSGSQLGNWREDSPIC